MINGNFEKTRIKILRNDMIKFREEHNILKPTVESLYTRIVNKIDEERQLQDLSWKELSMKSGVPMQRIIYAFIEKYSEFCVRLGLDDMLKLCISLDIDIGLVPIWLCNYGFKQEGNDKK